VTVSYQRDHAITGPLTRASELDSRDPLGGFLLKPFDYLFDGDYRHDVQIQSTTSRSVGLFDDVQIRCIQAGEGACRDDVPFLLRGDLDLGQPFRMNPYGAEQSFRLPLWTQGITGDIDLSREARWQARGAVQWQAGRLHRIRLGGDFSRMDTWRYHAPFGPISSFGIDAYHETPIRSGGYVEDRIAVGHVVIVGGLRWDGFNSRASYPRTPGRISTDASVPFDPNNPTANFVQASAHTALSPRLQASFSVAGTDLRVSLGRQVRMPPLDVLFRAKNTDLVVTNRVQFFGRDLDFTKSTLLELGIRHAFGEQLVLDVAVYNRSRPAEIVGRIVQLPDPGSNGAVADFRVFANADFAPTRGVEVKIDQRFSTLFSVSAFYALQNVDPTPQGGQGAPRASRHTIAGWGALTFPGDWRAGTRLGAILENTGVFATFRWTSGRHYTREFPQALGLTIGDLVQPIEPLNASVLPWFKTVDLRVTRGFGLGRYVGALFAESTNLLNFTNILGLFTETGDVVYRDFEDRYVAEQVTNLTNAAAAAGILLSGNTVDFNALGGCANWQGRNSGNFASGPVDCVLLERAERRFGNGDGVFTPPEYTSAFGAWYDLANAPYRFYGPGRRIRIGVEMAF
jgi:hypothetical protein